jgi:serine O-acetyltransferase
LVNSESVDISKVGDAQNLKDKEIIEFLGDN